MSTDLTDAVDGDETAITQLQADVAALQADVDALKQSPSNRMLITAVKTLQERVPKPDEVIDLSETETVTESEAAPTQENDTQAA